MIKPILKSIAVGALIGATIFFLPKFLLIPIALFMIFRMMMWRRMRMFQYLFADKIRSMSDDEYTQFKESKGRHYCHRRGNCSNQSFNQ